MIRAALAILRKDSRILASRGGVLSQSLALGLLLIFIFSMAAAPGENPAPRENATIFWIGSAFVAVIVFNQLYYLEEETGARGALLLCAAPIQSVWLGKVMAGFLLLLAVQAIFLPAIVVFLAQSRVAPWPGALAVPLTDAGLATLAGLMSAASCGSAARDSLLSVILFPLLIPPLMAGINLCAASFGADCESVDSWLALICAYDAVFAAASLLLFGFLYGGDE